MKNKNIINNIKNKQMDRKDFLKFSGLAMLSLAGVGRIIHDLNRDDDSQLKNVVSRQEIMSGYSNGGYSR